MVSSVNGVSCLTLHKIKECFLFWELLLGGLKLVSKPATLNDVVLDTSTLSASFHVVLWGPYHVPTARACSAAGIREQRWVRLGLCPEENHNSCVEKDTQGSSPRTSRDKGWHGFPEGFWAVGFVISRRSLFLGVFYPVSVVTNFIPSKEVWERR